MGLNDIPLLAMLKGKLGYLNQRQKLIAENVANADTPGYAPRDLKPFSFEAMVKGATAPRGLVRTDPAHLSGAADAAGGSDGEGFEEASPDSEVRLDGNGVVLEEQMSKLTEARIDYEAAVGFYQQSMNLITTAARKPGGS